MIKFALVGCGRISKRHSELLGEKPDIRSSVGSCMR